MQLLFKTTNKQLSDISLSTTLLVKITRDEPKTTYMVGSDQTQTAVRTKTFNT
jgi:hypothetical protein